MWNNQGGFDGGYGQQGGTEAFNSPGGFGTPQQSQERRGRSRVQNIFPCTVAQILNATQNEDKFQSGNVEISQVTVVGLVTSVNETPTRIDYEIDDMTGPPLEVKRFLEHDENAPEEEREQTMRENTYVRIYGHVRSFAGKRSVVAYKTVPLADMNELTCHILEVVKSNIAMSQGTGGVSGGGGMAVNGANNMDVNGESSAVIHGLNPTQTQVHTAIKSCGDQAEGASIEHICKFLRGVPEKQIREAIDFLSSEGHIYSTVDEDHYKATDS